MNMNESFDLVKSTIETVSNLSTAIYDPNVNVGIKSMEYISNTSQVISDGMIKFINDANSTKRVTSMELNIETSPSYIHVHASFNNSGVDLQVKNIRIFDVNNIQLFFEHSHIDLIWLELTRIEKFDISKI